jgi:hypothetical protein
MSLFNPCLVLYDYEPPKKTTAEDREDHKAQKRVSRMKDLVERLDEIVRRNP